MIFRRAKVASLAGLPLGKAGKDAVPNSRDFLVLLKKKNN